MDENQIAASVVAQATHQKDPLAVELGRRGGLKGGKVRAAKLSSAKRKSIARKAAKKRWKSASKKSLP